MSRVPYTVDIDNTICSELERMRKCCETLDFSLMPALIERVQYHANAMEGGLWARKNYHEWLTRLLEELSTQEINEQDFVNKVRKTVVENKGEW